MKMIVLQFTRVKNSSSVVEGSGGSVQRLGSGLHRVFARDSGLRCYTGKSLDEDFWVEDSAQSSSQGRIQRLSLRGHARFPFGAIYPQLMQNEMENEMETGGIDIGVVFGVYYFISCGEPGSNYLNLRVSGSKRTFETRNPDVYIQRQKALLSYPCNLP